MLKEMTDNMIIYVKAKINLAQSFVILVQKFLLKLLILPIVFYLFTYKYMFLFGYFYRFYSQEI